jgi:putative glycosyltransferase (TIGR04372 family)
MLKDYRCIASERLLSLEELVRLGVHKIIDQKSFSLLGIEVIENSPEDLGRLAQEIEDIYDGIWYPTKSNEKMMSKMRERFAASFTPPKDTYFANSWISNRTWFFD